LVAVGIGAERAGRRKSIVHLFVEPENDPLADIAVSSQ
jgi:hypothetical protein